MQKRPTVQIMSSPLCCQKNDLMHKRLLLPAIIVFILGTILGPLYPILHLTVLKNFNILEEQSIANDIERVRDFIDDNIRQISTTCADYAGWDDAYRFVQDSNAHFIKSNLGNDTYSKLRLNFIIYLNADGKPIYKKAYDYKLNREMPFPPSLAEHLAPSGLLVNLPTPESSSSGILCLPEGMTMVASRPVLTSDYHGPVKGTLVMGRYLDSDEMLRLSRTIHLQATVQNLKANAPSDEYQQARLAQAVGGGTYVHTVGNQRILGFGIGTDIYGKKGFIIRVETPRTIYQQGLRAVRHFYIWCVVLGIVAAFVIYFLLERVIVSRRSNEETEIRYRSIVENASEGIVLVEPETLAIIEANTSFSILVNTPLPDLVGRHLGEMIEEAERSFQVGSKQLTTFRLRNETLIFTEISTTQIPYRTATVLALIVRDITSRKLAEQALQESADQYRMITFTSMDGFWVVDQDGKIVDANAECVRLYGYDQEELLTLSIKDFEATRDPVETKHHIGQIMAAGYARFETRHRCKDGRIIEVEVSTNYMPSSRLFLTFIRDITARKQAEEDIHRMNEELEQRVVERTTQLEAANSALKQEIKQREKAQGVITQLNVVLQKQKQALEIANSELESFSYSVSHDLKAPLQRMSGFAEALLEDYGDALEPEAREYVTRLNVASQQLSDLINSLLHFSRVSRRPLNTVTVDLSTMLREIADALLDSHPERCISFQIEDDIVVNADATLMRIVLENLLGNACKYTRTKEKALIECGTINLNGKRAIFIRDNGVGFDMKYADKMFGAFQRLHGEKEFEGSGIGLATVQRIINRHGGSIRAEGKVNEGAAFYFVLA